MPRTGPRPKAWKVQGEIQHTQHTAWHRQRSQAHYRKEEWLLPFEDFQLLWSDHWHLRGKSNTSYCMSRRDPTEPWQLGNAEVIPRIEHLKRVRQQKMETRRELAF